MVFNRSQHKAARLKLELAQGITVVQDAEMEMLEVFRDTGEAQNVSVGEGRHRYISKLAKICRLIMFDIT